MTLHFFAPFLTFLLVLTFLLATFFFVAGAFAVGSGLILPLRPAGKFRPRLQLEIHDLSDSSLTLPCVSSINFSKSYSPARTASKTITLLDLPEILARWAFTGRPAS